MNLFLIVVYFELKSYFLHYSKQFYTHLALSDKNTRKTISEIIASVQAISIFHSKRSFMKHFLTVWLGVNIEYIKFTFIIQFIYGTTKVLKR